MKINSVAFSVFLLLVAVACMLPMSWASVLLYVPNVIWTALLLPFETIRFSWLLLTNVSLGMGGIVLYYILCSFFTDKWNLGKRTKSVLIFMTSLALTFIIFVNSVVTM